MCTVCTCIRFKRPQCHFSIWDNKVCLTWPELTWSLFPKTLGSIPWRGRVTGPILFSLSESTLFFCLQSRKRRAKSLRFNLIDLDLHSRSHAQVFIMKIINLCLFWESMPAMLIMFTVKIVRLMVSICPPPVWWPWPPLEVTSASQTWLLFYLQYLGRYLSYYSQTWHCLWTYILHIIKLMIVLMTLTLMQGHSGSAKANKISDECSRQLSKQLALNLLQQVGHVLRDLDFAIVNIDWPSFFFLFLFFLFLRYRQWI